METTGNKKSTPISLDISHLFFHVVSNLVKALVITYDEIFQTLAVGDVLLPKPFLDLGFNGVVRWKSPALKMFLQFAKHMKVRGGRVDVVRWVGWDPVYISLRGMK
jgi:hypothetical protein